MSDIFKFINLYIINLYAHLELFSKWLTKPLVINRNWTPYVTMIG